MGKRKAAAADGSVVPKRKAQKLAVAATLSEPLETVAAGPTNRQRSREKVLILASRGITFRSEAFSLWKLS